MTSAIELERLRERNRRLLAENADLRRQFIDSAAVVTVRIVPGLRWWYVRVMYPHVLMNAGPVQMIVRCRRLLDWFLFGVRR